MMCDLGNKLSLSYQYYFELIVFKLSVLSEMRTKSSLFNNILFYYMLQSDLGRRFLFFFFPVHNIILLLRHCLLFLVWISFDLKKEDIIFRFLLVTFNNLDNNDTTIIDSIPLLTLKSIILTSSSFRPKTLFYSDSNFQRPITVLFNYCFV